MDILNKEIYLQRMNFGMEDKLFFLSYLSPQITTVLDFGCANGDLGKMMKLYRPDLSYIGYDNSEEMRQSFNENIGTNGTFVSSYEEIKDFIHNGIIRPQETILVLSSVLHEVYSYSTFKEITAFWNFIQESSFAQVSVRDMGISEEEKHSQFNYACMVIKDYIESNYISWDQGNLFSDYYQLWLKYWYKENASRELWEDYFALSIDELKKEFTKTYNITYFQRFKIEYVVDKVKKDFGFNPFIYDTHYKAIFNLR